MQVDLREGAAEIRQMLIEGVSRYAAKHVHPKAGPFHPLVTAVELVFFLGQEVGLSLDTRPDRDWDGTWTHGWFMSVKLPEWQLTDNDDDAEDVAFVLLDGTTRTFPADTDVEAFAELFGHVLVTVLRTARDDGTLAGLPRVPSCELAVVELEGLYSWPSYEDRGKENLA